MRLQALGQSRPDLCLRTVCIGNGKDTHNAIERLTLESLNLTLALNNQSDGHALYTTC